MKDYHISAIYSDADRGYIADIPDLDTCSAFGNTPAEALKQAKVAKRAWLAAARAEKKPIPKPRYRLAIYQTNQHIIWFIRPGVQLLGAE